MSNQRGSLLFEFMLALILAAFASMVFLNQSRVTRGGMIIDSLLVEEAQQIQEVFQAAQLYHNAGKTAFPGPQLTTTVTAATLTAQGYLRSNFPATTPLGGTQQVVFLRDDAGHVTMLLVRDGFQDDAFLGRGQPTNTASVLRMYRRVADTLYREYHMEAGIVAPLATHATLAGAMALTVPMGAYLTASPNPRLIALAGQGNLMIEDAEHRTTLMDTTPP